MNLTTKGRYAVMAMADIAVHGGEKPMALSEIAKRQDIQLNYLEQIFMRLRKAGLVRSVRGPGGGYVLARDKDELLVSDIVLAADESIEMTRCSGSGGCMKDYGPCLTHDLWEGLGNRIYEYLQSVSLADLSNNKSSSIAQLRQHHG